jgi:trimethylamine---corrinoid protein Co-methyltransferase
LNFARCQKYPQPITIFTNEEIQKIHLATLEILESIGINILDEQTLELFRKKGARVDFENKLVKIDRDMVLQFIGKTPKSFSLYSQDYIEMKIGGDEFYVVSMVEEAYIVDAINLQRRDTRRIDLIEIIRLLDQLPYYHICCNPVIVHDMNPKLSIIYSAAEIYKNTTKNCLVVPSTGQEARFIIELGAAIAGSEQKLIEKPILSVSIAPSSPLKLPKNICEVIWEYAKRKLPIIIVHAPMVGATSPVTIAGAMAMANAESLATLTLIQLINEGTAVAYGGAAVKFDLRTGFPAYGSVEYGILSMITAQLGRFYGFPVYGAGGATNANLTDVQAGYEKMSSTMLGYLAGHDMLCDAGLNANGLISLDSIVIQNELFAQVNHLSKKILVNEDTLALDTIRNSMAGSNFLAEEHTLRNMKTDFRYSDIGNHQNYEEWESNGSIDGLHQAAGAAGKILSQYNQRNLTIQQENKINEILDRAKNEIL